MKEGSVMKGCIVSAESLPKRPSPPAPNKRSKQMIDPASEWQSGYDAGIKAAINALEADAKLCDCFAFEDDECACGAWWDYKSITSARAVEIVRDLTDLKRPSP
jgi:hypothetical protein